MELELGLKVTRTREDVSSSVDFRFSKDPFGPLVLSRETDSRFIIIIHLKGFKKEGIEIDINKEGDRITIRGRKPVEEMVMIRWMAWRKEVEMRAFRKVFLIPDVVDLDKVKARFDDDDATLIITMPKRVKGISGFNLEQEEEGVGFGDVSEAENKEEVEEESDEHSEVHEGGEYFGEMVEDEERESQVYEGDEEGFSGGVDETQIEDDGLEEIQQELADSDRESDDNVLKNLPDFMEQEDNQEVMEQKVSEETKSNEIGSGAVEEIEEQESDEDSSLAKLPGIIEKEDSQEVVEQKVSEETKSDDIGSGAVEEIEEQESDEDSGLKKLPDIIEQEDIQEVVEQKGSEETRSEDNGSGAVKEIEEQESDEDSGLKELPDMIEQEDNQEVMEHKVSEETKSEGIGSGAVEETEEQESNEIGGTSKRREMKKKKTDGGDDDDDGLRKAQGTEEPERHSEERKIQEMVDKETGGQEKDAKEESDEKETHNLEKSQQIVEEETVGEHEFTDSNTESEEIRSLRKLSDILEQENNQDVMEQKDSQEETRSKLQEIEKQEPYDQLDDETSKSKAKADDDDGLNKVQEIEEQERRNGVRKIQEMGEGFTPHIERTPVVVAEYDVAETKTKAEELESEKIEADKVDKKEEKDTKVRRESEDRRSLKKLQENEEQLSKGRKRQDEQENIQELVEEKTLEAETETVNDVPKPVQETESPENGTVVKTDDEGKEKKKSVKMETAPKIAENEAKPEDFESEKQGADEVDKIRKAVEKKAQENANVRAKGEDRSLVKLKENEVPHSKGRKRQEEAPERETNIVNDVPKLVQENEAPEVGTLGEVMEPKVSEEAKSDNTGSGAVEETEEQESIEDSGLEKLPDNIGKVMEQIVSEETKSGDSTGSGAVEEMEEQESDEVGGTSKSRAMEKQASDGDGLRQAHGTEEPKRHNEESKTPSGQEKNAKEECNGKETHTEDEHLEKKSQQQIDEQGKILESGAFEEIQKQEPQEQLDGTSKGREMADDDGLIKAQWIEELERRNEVSKIQEMVEGETSDHEKRSVKMKTSIDQKEEVGADTGKGFTPNIERTPVVAETETKSEELASIKPEADKVEKKHELVEKKEEEENDSKVIRRESEDRRSLIKLQEDDKEQHSKGRKGQENIKELVEEKAPEAETNIKNDVQKPVQETEAPEVGSVVKTDDEGKEKKKMETAPNIAETEAKLEGIVSEKQGAAEVEKKEEEDDNVRAKGEDSILTKLQENEEQYSKGRKEQEKQENVKELVEEKAPEAETNIVNDVPKPVQEETGDEGKHQKGKKIVANIAESETKPEDFVPDQLLVEKKKEEEENGKAQSEDSSSIKPQEVREEQSQQGQKQEKIEELVEEQTPEEEETNISNDDLKPVQERGKEKQTAPNIAKTELGNDDILRKAGDDQQRYSDAKEEVDAKMGKGFAPNVVETETKPEKIESEKLGADDEVEKKEEEDTNVRAKKSEDRSLIKLQEVGTLGETYDEGKEEEEKSVGLEVRNRDAKEEVDGKMGVQEIPETETKPEEFESDELKADEVDKIHELVEKKKEETNSKAGTESEDKKIEELVKEKTPQDDTLKPIQERCEGKEKIQKLIQEETKKHPEEYKEKMVETGEKIDDDAGSRKVQEEKGSGKTETKEQDSYKPKVLWEEEMAEKKIEFDDDDHNQSSRRAGDTEERDAGSNEGFDAEMGKGFTLNIAETETKADEVNENDEIHEVVEKKEEENVKVRRQDEDRSLIKLQENERQHSKRQKRQEKTAETETNIPTPVQETGDEGKEKKKSVTPNTAETETKTEEFESDEIHELVEKKEEEEEDNDMMRGQTEDSNLCVKLHETKEEQFQAQKRHDKKEKIKDLVEEKTPAVETDTETVEQESCRPTVFGDDDDLHVSRRVGDTGQRDSDDAKEEVDTETEKAETEKKAEEFESDTVKEIEEEDRIHELVEKKKEENATGRKKSEDISLKRLQEEKFQEPIPHNKQEEIKESVEEKQETVQETERPDVSTLDTCEEKVFSETETKDQESYRPKILEDKIQELTEEKMNISRRVEEEEDTAEKKTDLGEDDMSSKIQEIDAMKVQEEKEEFQEQVLEEKVRDGANKIVAEAIIAENDKSRKVQEINEQKSHEENEPGNQVQELIGGETSGQGEVKGVESEKKTTEVDKRSREELQKIERIDSGVSGKYFKELQEKEKEDEADRPKKRTGTIEQELVNLNSQIEQETGEKTQELLDENINNCKEDKSETKTDDVIRKVQGIKEQELLEPTRNHARKTEEVIKEKVSEPETESVSSGLSKVVDYIRITEKEKSPTAQESKDQRPEKNSNEKQYEIQELVEGGHREEQNDEKLTVKAKQETEEETSKGVQETEQQEPDGLSSSVVQDKKQEIEERRTETEDVRLRQEEDKIQEPVEMGKSGYKERVKKQDGVDNSRSQEPGKPNLDELERHGSEREDKIDGPAELWIHDDREKDKKQDGDDVPKSVEEEKVENMGELERKVEDESLDKFHEFEERKSYEDWTHERQEKSKEEATDPKESEGREKTREVEEKETVERRTRTRDGSLRKAQDDSEPELSKPYKPQEEDKVQESVERRTSDYREELKKQDGNDTSRSKELGKPSLVTEEATAKEGHSDRKEEQNEEKVITKAELKAEEDNSIKVQEIENQKSDELQRSLVQDKMKETKEKEKTKAMEENEIVERRTKTEDGSLREVQDGKEAESSKLYKRRDEDNIKELVEMKTSDYREKVKKQDGDDILRSQETEKLDLVEEEATIPKDEHTGGKEEPEVKEERYEKVAQTETKVEDEINKEVEENQKEEVGSLDDPMTKTQESEKGESMIHEKLNIVRDFVEEEARDQKDEVAMEAAAIEANHDEEKHEEKFIPKAEVKAEEDSSEQEFDGLQRSLGQDKMQETEEKRKPRSVEENETVEGSTKTEDGSLRKVEEGEDPELSRHKRHEEELKKEDEDGILRSQETSKVVLGEEDEKQELDIVQHIVEDKTWDQEDDRVGEEAEAVVGNNEKDSSRKLHTTEGEELKEQEEIPATSHPREEEGAGERVSEKETKMEKVHVQEPVGKTENQESRRGQKGKQEMNDETSSEDGIVRKVGETKVQESDEKKDQEPGGKIEENMQQRMDAGKQEDEGKSEAGVEIQGKIKEERGIEGSEKVAEVEMQAKIGIRMKDQETKRQELYELLENEEHDKITEPTVEGTKYQREEEREVEEMKRRSEDVSSSKVQNSKAQEEDGLEKHRELSWFQENQLVKEEEELNEAGGYKAVMKTKSMEDSRQSQDVEEKESDQTEKEKRMPHVESKDNDDSSRKNDTERWRGQEQKKDHQEVVEIEASDQKKEEREEKIVGKAVTRDEWDNSRKNQEHEGEQLDKLERHGEEEMSGYKEKNRGNRACAETTMKDDGFIEEQLEIVLRHSEQDKKQLVVEKDTSGKAKDKRNQETKSKDDSSKKTLENEKQDCHEQKRNYEEQDKKKSSKTHQIIEKENRETEDADGSSKKIQEIDKEGSSEPRRDEERDKIQPVDSETSEDDSEELEVEVEDSEEDWEAEVIQEMDSDEDNDKLRKIRRIKLGFRLVGGSTLFMSLIVIVISIIRSKRKTKCYKF